MPEQLSHRINASVVKAWFQYRCERKTRYEMLTPEALAEVEIYGTKKQRPWAYLGTQFELRVVESLGSQVIRPTTAKGGVWSSVARAFLEGRTRERFVHQIDLRPFAPPAVLRLPPSVSVGPTLADLVEMRHGEGGPRLTVIDVKATRRSTSFQKAQVAFYAILLEERLREIGADLKVDDRGEIWRMPDGTPGTERLYQVDEFSLAPYRRMVVAFCEQDLPRILAAQISPGINRTFFHVYYKCEECDFLEAHCRKAVSPPLPAADRDVSAVAGLTHEAKRSLQRASTNTVGQLAAAEGLDRRRGLSWSLQRRARLLVRRAQAVCAGAVLRTDEKFSMLMPRRVGTAIYLSADYDPVGDRLASIACMISRDGEADATTVVRVMSSAGEGSEADALHDVFSAVIGELEAIDRHNRRADLAVGEAIHAHIFLYEPSEAVAIQGAVGRHLDDARVRHGLLNMVRLFPPDDVVPEPEFRGVHHLPATAVRMVVEQLYALPVTVSHDLSQTSRVLADAGMTGRAYRPEEPFARPFSSLLSIDVMRGLEARDQTPSIAAVEEDVVARLNAMRAIVGFLFEADAAQSLQVDGPMLRLAKRPFRFWETFDPLEAGDLDVLQAFELVENRAGLLARMVELARPVDRRLDSGKCIAGLTLLSIPGRRDARPRLVFEVPEASRGSDLGPDSFGLVLTDGDHEVLLDYASWGDVACAIEGNRDAGETMTVGMRRAAFDSPAFQAMYARSRSTRGAWCVDLIFKDPNTERVAAYLEHLANGDGL